MKFNCLDNNEKILGVVKAENEKEALDKARKLNNSVAGVVPCENQESVAVLEVSAPAPKKRKGSVGASEA